MRFNEVNSSEMLFCTYTNVDIFSYIINKYKGLILDIKPDTIIVQITGAVDEVTDFHKEVNHIGIIESARTGITAIEKGWITLMET